MNTPPCVTTNALTAAPHVVSLGDRLGGCADYSFFISLLYPLHTPITDPGDMAWSTMSKAGTKQHLDDGRGRGERAKVIAKHGLADHVQRQLREAGLHVDAAARGGHALSTIPHPSSRENTANLLGTTAISCDYQKEQTLSTDCLNCVLDFMHPVACWMPQHVTAATALAGRPHIPAQGQRRLWHTARVRRRHGRRNNAGMHNSAPRASSLAQSCSAAQSPNRQLLADVFKAARVPPAWRTAAPRTARTRGRPWSAGMRGAAPARPPSAARARGRRRRSQSLSQRGTPTPVVGPVFKCWQIYVTRYRTYRDAFTSSPSSQHMLLAPTDEQSEGALCHSRSAPRQQAP